MPSQLILKEIAGFLSRHPPYDALPDQARIWMAQAMTVQYFAPGEVLLKRGEKPPALWIVQRGGVAGHPEPIPAQRQDVDRASIELAIGDSFPVGALFADRAVENSYWAIDDCFVLALDRDHFFELVSQHKALAEFARRRLGALLDLARRQHGAELAARAIEEQDLSRSLAQMIRRPAVVCLPDTPIRKVFETMEALQVGSVIIVDETTHQGQGILTRQDVIGRVVLPEVALNRPVSEVMSSPLFTMQADDTATQAAIRMADHGIRHIAVVDQRSRIIGVVTERDLFALQRRSLRDVARRLDQASSLTDLIAVAQDIRSLSESLASQGLDAGPLTALISRLNDHLTRRLLQLTAKGFSLHGRWCWVVFGSEGRQEQTIATDQDNGLMIEIDGASTAMSIDADIDEIYEAFAREVNQGLAACGFPLCKGGIMAQTANHRLTVAAWRSRFEAWIDRGDPESLLATSIYFDARPLAGDCAIAENLLHAVADHASKAPRFIHQMARNALRNHPPSGWGQGFGVWFSTDHGLIDLKLQGSMPFVDAARLWALAHGVRETSTELRFKKLADRALLPRSEVQAWLGAFEAIQMFRLKSQVQRAGSERPNHIDVKALSELDQRILREAFRQGRKVQQRLAADFPGT